MWVRASRDPVHRLQIVKSTFAFVIDSVIYDGRMREKIHLHHSHALNADPLQWQCRPRNALKIPRRIMLISHHLTISLASHAHFKHIICTIFSVIHVTEFRHSDPFTFSTVVFGNVCYKLTQLLICFIVPQPRSLAPSPFLSS